MGGEGKWAGKQDPGCCLSFVQKVPSLLYPWDLVVMARLLIAVADFRDAPGRPFHLTFSQAKKKAKFRHLNRCRFMSPDVSRPIYTRSVWLKCMLYARGIGLWLLRSRAEGAWSQGVSHSLGFLSFPFDLQNFKTNKQKLPGPDRLNHLQTAPKWKKKIYLLEIWKYPCVCWARFSGLNDPDQQVCCGVQLEIP